MRFSRKKKVWLTGLAIVLSIGTAGAGMIVRDHASTPGDSIPNPATSPLDDRLPTVQTIRPKQDSSFQVSVQQLARVEAYFHANLRSRVAGVVKRVTKDIGSSVRRGELLVEIEVPELDREVEQKEAVIAQRRQELLLAHAQVKSAMAGLAIGQTGIQMKESEVGQTEAVRDYRRKRLARFRQLADRGAITGDIVDEQQRECEEAESAYESAQVAVRKAQADYAEKESSLEAAQADIKLKEALVEVARKDRDRTLALIGYARIVAPFDGVITRRTTDPGAFVHSSSTSASEPLVSVARVDIVTVSMKLPDNAAPFVTTNTEAVLQMDDLPGIPIRGKVTRFSPAINEQDRTMRVEVDLFNGSEKDFCGMHAHAAGANLAALGQRDPFACLTLSGAGQLVMSQDFKNYEDGLPFRARTTDGAAVPYRLLPGMTGYMRLSLDKFANTYLLPSSAVFSMTGKPYILVVQDGVTRLVPVKIQVNDGKLVKVAALARDASRPGAREAYQELTGDEEIVPSRQIEIGEGQRVKPVPVRW